MQAKSGPMSHYMEVISQPLKLQSKFNKENVWIVL